MKIEELSIGDWVRYDFPKIGKSNIQVNSIDEEDNHIGAGGVGASAWSDVSEFEPIPLTPEILEKNGVHFVGNLDDDDDDRLFACPSFSVIWLKGRGEWAFSVPQSWLYIRSVHQLQHALRLAGIGKEIEL